MTDVAGGLITLEYMLEGLGYGAKLDASVGELSARDKDIATYIAAATPVIEHLAGPVLQRTGIQRGSGGKSAMLLSGRIANSAAVTAVRVDGTAVTGFTVDAEAGILYAPAGTAFTAGVRNIEVDITTGYSPVPETLQLATRELVRHWIQTGKEAPTPSQLQAALESDDPNDPYAIPRRVRQMCAPFALGGFA